MEKIAIIHKKTGKVHYARDPFKHPEPLCYTAIKTNLGYSFCVGQPITCKYCQQPYFELRSHVEEGYWTRQIKKALEVRKMFKCPFELFANKHGYSLKHDQLIFPDSAIEFQRRRRNFYGIPRHGWAWEHAMFNFGGLPKNISIKPVGSREHMYNDKVELVKFMQYEVDGLFLEWELIVGDKS